MECLLLEPRPAIRGFSVTAQIAVFLVATAIVIQAILSQIVAECAQSDAQARGGVCEREPGVKEVHQTGVCLENDGQIGEWAKVKGVFGRIHGMLLNGVQISLYGCIYS